jgi:hypothetical protein
MKSTRLQITENTSISVALLIPVIGLGMTIVSVLISISVVDARTDLRLSQQEKITDITAAKVDIIDQRTARMEGVLDEMRRKR